MKFKCANIAILIIFMAFLSTGCGSSGGGDSTTTDSTTADKISLATSQVSVKSDNLDFATITATVLDTNNAVVEGVTVSFSANEGQISYASVDTDENGKAEITFSSGTDKTNRVATITAQVSGLSSVQIPIQITGTTISLSTDSTNIAVYESPATLTILVQGADGFGVESLVTLSAEPAGVVTLSQYTGNTDTSGNLEVYITGVAAGSVIVTVQALGATATQDYTVGTSDEVFCITSPTDDPCSLSTNIDLTITVNAPTQEYVQFATTLGTWDWGADLVVTKAVSGGSASAVLTSSEAGTANVQVFDAADPSTTDSLTVIFSAPSSEATQVALQASATVMPPSTEDVTNSVTLTATVKNVTDQVVSNAAVAFSIENPTGGGESIFPVVAYTNAYGVANSTFTSGSLSTDAEGVTAKVTVVGTSITDTVNIVIGGTAGSVVIGRSTVIESINDDTAYKLPMSVLVADSNGNPVSSATVSIGAWPLQYSTGYTTISGPVVTGTYDNEDANRNLIRDADEDTGSSGNPCDGDGQLTPLSSAAGSLPATVTTDENGVANFDLVYLKQYAAWIVEEIRASTLVLGTETTSILEFRLPYLENEKEHIPNSPYGGGSFTITASSIGYGSISPSGEVEVAYGDDQLFIITPYVDDVSSVWVDGEIVGTDLNSYLFENVTEDHTIQVIFEEDEPDDIFTITASAGDNGTISPSGEVEVAYGDDQTFVITPDSGYVPSVLVDGWPATEELTQELDKYYYKFENVKEDRTIDVTFVEVAP